MGGGGAAASCIYRHVLHPKGRRKTLLFFNYPPSVMPKNRLQVTLSCLFLFNEFQNSKNFAELTEKNIKQYIYDTFERSTSRFNQYFSYKEDFFCSFSLNIYQHSM
jgi:hypothetical protein